MLIRRPRDLEYSDVTPKTQYINRRRLLAGAVAFGALNRLEAATSAQKLSAAKSQFSTSEQLTPLDAITHYNNFYEFGTDKEDPSKNAYKLRTSPWTVKVEGAVQKPLTLALDDLF